MRLEFWEEMLLARENHIWYTIKQHEMKDIIETDECMEFFAILYDDGTAVWILNGYEKKTERIPKRELKRAKQLKRKYGL